VPVIMTWLVPITTGEAAAIRRDGWASMEQVFAAQNPDLADPGRPQVTLDAP
jgi:hypothetical protein